MIIEEMKKADAPSIAAIERACFASPWTRQGIEEEADNPSSHFLKATDEESGVTAGYIGVQEICGEAYITNIAVLPEYRGRGTGRQLLIAACEGAKERDCSFITLEVRVSNLPAISLYESCGFKEAGRRKNFYRSPDEDGLIYTLFFGREGENG